MPPTGCTVTPSTATTACSAQPSGSATTRRLPCGTSTVVRVPAVCPVVVTSRTPSGVSSRSRGGATRSCADPGGADPPHLPPVAGRDALEAVGGVEPAGDLGHQAGPHREQVGGGVGEQGRPGGGVAQGRADPVGERAVGVGDRGQRAHQVGRLAPDEAVAGASRAGADEEGSGGEGPLGLVDRDGRARVLPRGDLGAEGRPRHPTGGDDDRGHRDRDGGAPRDGRAATGGLGPAQRHAVEPARERQDEHAGRAAAAARPTRAGSARPPPRPRRARCRAGCRVRPGRARAAPAPGG